MNAEPDALGGSVITDFQSLYKASVYKGIYHVNAVAPAHLSGAGNFTITGEALGRANGIGELIEDSHHGELTGIKVHLPLSRKIIICSRIVARRDPPGLSTSLWLRRRFGLNRCSGLKGSQ